MAMADRELIERLLFLAETAVDQALDLNYDDPEDYFIYRELRELKAVVAAQPEPQGPGPTDDELQKIADAMRDEDDTLSLVEYARAVLARWGRPTVEPVPLSERPWEREGWCDPIGKCWWWNPATTALGTPWWSYEPWEWMEDAAYSLPHWALPVPEPEAHNG